MTMINKVEIIKIIKSGGMKQYIEPTKKVALELKIISDKIKNEISEMEKEDKAFWDSYNEIVGHHEKGLSMEDILELYQQEKTKKEIEENKNDVLELFKNRLQSLKMALGVNA